MTPHDPEPVFKDKGGELDVAHGWCTGNESSIVSAERCGCFHCGEVFQAAEINEWIGDRTGRTAICPRCGVDSVLPGTRPEFLDPAFLAAMNRRWFS